jgi:glycosyltransferase involved in cell wall biosynthesis
MLSHDAPWNSYDGQMQSPRVLHLATSLAGGAGIATRRIVEAQINQGINAQLSAANYLGSKLEAHESILPRSSLNKFKSKTLTLFQTKLMQKNELLVTPFSVNSVKNWNKKVRDIDVIHLHAFYNLIKLETLEELSSIAPIVITMHDQRLFTGGCHYSMDCDGYKRECGRCPQVHTIFNRVPGAQLKKSIQSLSTLNQITIISPSTWLARLAEDSNLLFGKKVAVINNPVPNLFRPGIKETSNRNDALRIGFISENLNNPYKGINVLADALNRLPTDSNVEIKFIGKGPHPEILSGVKISQTYSNNPNDIAKEIRSCDAIVVPSYQDNSPSVVSESLMSGVPVIGSRVGGITEILDEFQLPSFESGNSKQLAQIIVDFDSSIRIEKIQTRVNEKFSFKTSAAQHLALYRNISS